MDTGKKQNRWRRLLRRGANLLKRSGWVSGYNFGRSDTNTPIPEGKTTFDVADKFCMVGAIRKVAGVRDPNGIYEGTTCNKEYNKAIHAILAKFPECHGRVYRLNDGSDKETVIAKMLEVANGD